MKTPSLLDAWLNHGSIVVDAFSADGAGRERHVQIVKVRDVRSGEDGGGGAVAPACDARRKLGEEGEGP